MVANIEKFDLVILQGGSGESLTPQNRNYFSKKVQEYVDKIKSIGSKAALLMIPSYVKPHKNYDPKLIARQYSNSGADCLSILTEEKYFIHSIDQNSNGQDVPVSSGFEYPVSLFRKKSPKIKKKNAIDKLYVYSCD